MTRKIPRCKRILPREEFFRLKDIHDDNPWLAYENVLGLYELWNLTENENQKELLEFLIQKFSYVDSDDLRNACKAIADQIENVWQLSSENTIITAICDNAEPDGSQFLVQALKNKLSSGNWKKKLFNAITTAAHTVNGNTNIVIIDDFIGTGDKVARKIKYIQETLNRRNVVGINLYVCSLATMNFSREKLLPLVKGLFSYIWLSKGISELAPEDKREVYTLEMLNMEKHLKFAGKQRQKYSFGYGQSETLFSIDSTNVPNNVFPIFWWKLIEPGVEREPILRRL